MTRLTLVTLQDSLPPLGLAYIASYLIKYGNFSIQDIKIVTYDALHSEFELNRIIRKIKKTMPDLVGISSVTQEFSMATRVADEIKKRMDIPILVGGPHITALPHTLPKSFDIAVLGEGEQTMLELMQFYEKWGLDKSKLTDIKGIAYHNSKNITVNERRELIQPLDKIPFPARELLDMKRFTRPRWVFGSYRRRGTHMVTSRGCPYNCIFCSTQHFWGKPPRFFHAEYVVSEIKELIEKYKVEAVNFYDDLFILSRKRLKKIFQQIKEEGINEKVEFFCLVRANLLDDELVKLLKRMNVKAVSIGLESGSEKILGLLKKNTVTVKQNQKALDLCKKYGIVNESSFMIGCPEETYEDILLTFEFIRQARRLGTLRTYSVYICTPFPGTELWEYAKRRGVVKDSMDWGRFKIDISDELKENVIIANKLSKEELWRLAETARQMQLRDSYKAFNFKTKDLLSTATLLDFISHPKVFISSVAKIIYHKLLS